jgi:hypothetical protein
MLKLIVEQNWAGTANLGSCYQKMRWEKFKVQAVWISSLLIKFNVALTER